VGEAALTVIFGGSNRLLSAGEEAVPEGIVQGSRRPTAAVRRQVDAAATDAEGKLRCQYCGQELTTDYGYPNSREFDHVTPYARGGSSEFDNIVDSCRTCNRSKGARTPDEWQGPN
jgi:5-methylcytosine-specific restriction endonuclease McrA